MSRTKARNSGRKRVERPAGKVRRSQMVTTFGVGSMLDLVDRAVLVGGLDFWRQPRDKFVLEEPRLRERLAPRLAAAGYSLSEDQAFLEPPQGDDKAPDTACGVEVLEFPTWFVCQGCRALVRSGSLQVEGDRYRHQCNRQSKGDLVPVRFVTTCSRGHLEDFPWVHYAHRNHSDSTCGGTRLFLYEGASGDFSQIRVHCATCRASERLAAAMVRGSLPQCRGHRPWLGADAQQDCPEFLRLLVRTASNAYFSQVESLLSLPELEDPLRRVVDRLWDTLKSATAETLTAFRTIEKVGASLEGYTNTQVLGVVEARRAGQEPELPPPRTAEFQYFISQPPEQPGEQPAEADILFARRRQAPPPAGIASVILVRKLEEVRTQIGFTRLEPLTANLQGEYDLDVRLALLGRATTWLPATRLIGEGVVVQLDEAAVQAWEQRPAVRQREQELQRGFEAYVADREVPRFPGIRFYLVHSLSHLLLNAISLDCGYSASAIRERLYCAPADDPQPMAAILLSTGTPGTEGTLGGLVEQGSDLLRHLRQGWDLGHLCSNDPVCGSHSPDRDLSERHLEGAACHGCLYLAECSCERFNHYLDRALVVPTMGQPCELAFFEQRP